MILLREYHAGSFSSWFQMVEIAIKSVQLTWVLLWMIEFAIRHLWRQTYLAC